MDGNEQISSKEYNKINETFNELKSIILKLNIRDTFKKFDMQIAELNEKVEKTSSYYDGQFDELRNIYKRLEKAVQKIGSECWTLTEQFRELSQKNKLVENVSENNIKTILREIEQLHLDISRLKAISETGNSPQGRTASAGRDLNGNTAKTPGKNTLSGNPATKVMKHGFINDYARMTGSEFINKYSCMEMSLCNYSEMRTGHADVPEFHNEPGNFLMLLQNNIFYLLPEKSFLENPGSRPVISKVFEIDAGLSGGQLQAACIISPSVLKKKDAKTWTCIEKGKIRS
jgi:hypothetical protein